MIIHPDFQQFTPFMEQIERYFVESDATIHKARNELKVIAYEGVELVVKAFRRPNALNRFVYAALRDSKAKKSYDNAITLQELGITTPRPVGYIEFKTAVSFGKSYFVSLKVPYDFTIREPLLNPDWPDHDRIMREFGAFTATLHQKGVLHRDYSPGNILITKTQEGYRFDLVDINRMRFGGVSREEGYKNLSKLWGNSTDLTLIAQGYAEAMGLDEKQSIRSIIRYDEKHKAFKQFKRRLKGQS